MILVAGGDSLIYGSELSDCDNNCSQLVYPALLAKKYNLDYDCVAWPGNANNAITRMVMTKCYELLLKKARFGVIVQWSFLPRYEFRFNFDTKQRISPWYSINPWTIEDDLDSITKNFFNDNHDIKHSQIANIKNAQNLGISQFAKSFYYNIGDSKYYELYTSLKEFLFLQNFLQTNHIPYLFAAAENNFYSMPNYTGRTDKFLQTLYEQIIWDNWFFFLGNEKYGAQIGFYTWATINKYRMGTTHPLEEAHNDSAKLINPKFTNLILDKLHHKRDKL